jgi:GDP-L-fucose synthase
MMKKILVTGKNGLVGSSIKRISQNYNYEFVFVGKEDYDLMDILSIKQMFTDIRPDYLIHTAASVGGIGLNLKHPSSQFYNNIIMNTNVIHESLIFGVKKLINFSSICAFPEDATLLNEKTLHSGKPYPAHFGYAHAKRTADIQIEIYRKEFNVDYCSILPVNIFGKNDNYNLETSHVIPSLIHKCFLSKKNNTKFQVWGDGTPKREFIYSEDLAKICLDMLSLEMMPQILLASNSHEISIKEVVTKICEIFDYYDVEWLTNKPNGQLSRTTDNSLLIQTLGHVHFSDFENSLKESIEWFIKNYPNIRI